MNGFVLPTILGRGIGLEVVHVNVAGPAFQIDHDDGLVADPLLGCAPGAQAQDIGQSQAAGAQPADLEEAATGDAVTRLAAGSRGEDGQHGELQIRSRGGDGSHPSRRAGWQGPQLWNRCSPRLLVRGRSVPPTFHFFLRAPRIRFSTPRNPRRMGEVWPPTGLNLARGKRGFRPGGRPATKLGKAHRHGRACQHSSAACGRTQQRVCRYKCEVGMGPSKAAEFFKKKTDAPPEFVHCICRGIATSVRPD